MFADFTVQWRRMRTTYLAELACLLVILFVALLVLAYVDLNDSCLHKLQMIHNEPQQVCAATEALRRSHRSNWSIAASLGTEWCQAQAGKPERTKRNEDAKWLQQEEQNHAESKVATVAYCSPLPSLPIITVMLSISCCQLQSFMAAYCSSEAIMRLTWLLSFWMMSNPTSTSSCSTEMPQQVVERLNTGGSGQWLCDHGALHRPHQQDNVRNMLRMLRHCWVVSGAETRESSCTSPFSTSWRCWAITSQLGMPGSSLP